MAIVFDPTKIAKRVAPEAKIKRMVKGNLTLKKTALTFANGLKEVDDISFRIDKSQLSNVALKTIRSYQERVARVQAEAGERSAGDAIERELATNPRQLIQRVQNEVIFQVHEGIKKNYKGKRARWLPSDADEPRPEHQLNYGKEYIIGEGINGVEPGDEWGCKCGVEILTDDDELRLD